MQEVQMVWDAIGCQGVSARSTDGLGCYCVVSLMVVVEGGRGKKYGEAYEVRENRGLRKG